MKSIIAICLSLALGACTDIVQCAPNRGPCAHTTVVDWNAVGTAVGGVIIIGLEGAAIAEGAGYAPPPQPALHCNTYVMGTISHTDCY